MRMNKTEWKPDYSVTPRRIVCAANIHRKSGKIICGARHWDQIMRGQVSRRFFKPVDWDQGFIDQFGDWMTREEAWIIAVEQNQIRRDVSCAGTLYSENLY